MPKSLSRLLIEADGDIRNVPLGEVLTDEQLKVVVAILNRPGDDMDKVPALKHYLNQHAAELEAKGVVPDYLAYFLAYNAPNLRRYMSGLN